MIQRRIKLGITVIEYAADNNHGFSRFVEVVFGVKFEVLPILSSSTQLSSKKQEAIPSGQEE